MSEEVLPEVWQAWQSYDPCPCGVPVCIENVRSVKLQMNPKRNHHVVGCRCPSCNGSRSRAKGRKSQTDGLKKLGHTGKNAADEEVNSATTIKVQIEFKKGYKAKTVMFYKFILTVFFERALKQATDAVRIGEGSLPGVMIDENWLVVDCRKGVK